MLPQSPQLRGSVWVLVQEMRPFPALQAVSPCAQVAAHLPCEQRGVPPVHCTPQPPQLYGLFAWLTQVLPPFWLGHDEKPGRHTQDPSEQYWVLAHWVLHPPQWVGLSWVSKQAVKDPPLNVQALSPASHSHLPALQVWKLALQAVAQAPQCAISLLRSTHWFPHRVCPWGHSHFPELHDAPAAHLVPQPPQLFTSLEASEQTPLQST